MKKFTLLCFLLLLQTLCLWAAPRSREQMLLEAKQILMKTNWNAPELAARATVSTPEMLRQESQLAVIGYQQGGFAIIASDDRINAVLGYCSGQYNEQSMPPAMLWWLSTMNAAIETRLQNNLLGATVKPADSNLPATVSPMLSCTWDQHAPYNNQCPVDVTDNTKRYVTGCVATVMAQLMYHYQFPAQPTATIPGYSYHPNADPSQDASIPDLEPTPFVWANMLAKYKAGQYSEEQGNAVATLMYYCGAAAKMVYGEISGSTLLDAVNGFNKYLNYSAKYYERSHISDSEWMKLVFGELANNHPVGYGGINMSKTMGHAFIFDGYDEEGRMHVNWGWNGACDGYYDINTLKVESMGDFPSEQTLCFARPLNNEENRIPYSSQWTANITGDQPISVSGSKLVIAIITCHNIDAEPFSGKLALALAPEAGEVKYYPLSQELQNINYHEGVTLSNFSFPISDIPEGKSRIYMVSKDNRETSWQPMHSGETGVACLDLERTGTKIVFSKQNSSWITAIKGIEVSAPTTQAGKQTIVYDAMGKPLQRVNGNGATLQQLPYKGLLIIKKGNRTIKVSK